MSAPSRHQHRSWRGNTLALLALAAGTILMAQAPSAAPDGPGPASPRPPASPMAVPTDPLFAPPSIDPLDQPSGRGPGVEAPAEIIGSWYTGTVSDIGYVDPNSGSYSSGGGEGLFYAFAPDGAWEFGYLLSSQLYGCAMRVLVYRSGSLAAADPTTHILELDTHLAQIHSEDTCAADNNYERALPPDDETLIWERTSDEYGELLLLRGPATGYSAFRPMDR
jgi:hypothetical protein